MLDRYGERWLSSGGSLLLGLFMWTCILASDYEMLLFFLLLTGVWYGTAQPGGSKVILQWFSERERGLAMGVRQAGIPIGGALAGMILPWVAEWRGVDMAVFLAGALAVLAGILFGWLYRNPVQETEAQSTARVQKDPKFQLPTGLYPVLLAGIVMVSLQMVIVSHGMMFATEELQIPRLTAGRLFSTALLSGMIGRMVLAWWSDRMWKGERMQPLFWTMTAAAGGASAMVLVPGQAAVWIWLLVYAWIGFIGIGWYSLFLVEVAERADSSSVGMTVSFALTVNQAAVITAPAGFGWLADVLGSYRWAWAILASGLVFAAVWMRAVNHAGGEKSADEGSAGSI
jgi:sugar phosphate permease